MDEIDRGPPDLATALSASMILWLLLAIGIVLVAGCTPFRDTSEGRYIEAQAETLEAQLEAVRDLHRQINAAFDRRVRHGMEQSDD